jgi:hypothetical protein
VVVRPSTWTAAARLDRERFVHAVAALVDRARGAMPAGGQLTIATDLVTIDAAARLDRPWLRDGGYVQLLVEDSGPGLDADAAAHVFEPFYDRTSRDAEGRFGLASVYGFVKQSQGFVWVEPGYERRLRWRGTRVVVLLPMTARPPGVRRGRSAAPARTAPAARPRRRGRGRVLGARIADARARAKTDSRCTRSARRGRRGRAAGLLRRAPDGHQPARHDWCGTGAAGPAATPDTRILLMSGFAREEYLTPADDLPFIGEAVHVARDRRTPAGDPRRACHGDARRSAN